MGYDYHDLSQPRGYENLYRHIRGTLGAEKPPLGKTRYTRTIYSNFLPTVEGKLFGRKDELALLDKAWADPQTHVVQFVASGGTGKTKLLKHWLDTNTESTNTESIEALIAWSFYSQGSSEDKQVSATPFFSHVFGVLKSEKTQFNTEEEKGEHLAHLLRQRRCLLVLDGLEPLQHAGRGMRGELKDRAIRQLLKSLAGEHNSLCIITTRLAVHELSDRAHVISHDLQNLAPDDGVSLLKSWEVHGSETELEKAVHEYGCHALALHLLGNALHTYLDGDVRKRDTLGELIDDYDDAGRHAFKVMQAYSHWLAGTPELQLLHLLGLFDHPIETDVLQVLLEARIPGLTAPPKTFWQTLFKKQHKLTQEEEKAWKVAIRDLREKHRMLSVHEGGPDLLDCHPLIREYFGNQLKKQQPQGWRQAHKNLYEYYKTLPEKELPDTLDEMQPLFRAVRHGCAAGLYRQALEVFWLRIRRKDVHFICSKIGGFNDDLATVSNFFTTLWQSPISSLTNNQRAAIVGWAGFDLRALRRLDEALILMHTSLEMFTKQKDWENAASSASSLGELQLILGDVTHAKINSQNSVQYADQYGDLFYRILCRATYADVLHQAGEVALASTVFQTAEQFQSEFMPKFPLLISVQGFRYCDVLLSKKSEETVLQRVKYALPVSETLNDLLGIALYQLSFGRAYCQQKEFSQAINWIDQAIGGFRKAGTQHYLPLGLLVRAALYRDTRDFARAQADLQEVFDIADGSRMRLHLTDYHLEMARLLVAEEENPPQSPFCKGGSQEAAGSAVPPFEKGGLGGISLQAHIEAAAKLINETGYHRRDAELADLKTKIPT